MKYIVFELISGEGIYQEEIPDVDLFDCFLEGTPVEYQGVQYSLMAARTTNTPPPPNIRDGDGRISVPKVNRWRKSLGLD